MLNTAWLALGVLGLTIALFLYGRWRHDVVAVAALLACTALGLVPGQEAFVGFSHPAVVTVVGVLILSDSLERTGLVDVIAEHALPKTQSQFLAVLSVTALGAFFSAFMNNVGALALLMPIALQTAQRLNIPPGHMLMPLSFGTILGGITTLIGTPSNLIVSSFRASVSEDSTGFAMFDFSPVGGTVALIGVFFISWLGPKLIPKRLQTRNTGLEVTTYLTETRVLPDTKAVNMRIAELEAQLRESDAQIVGLLRHQLRINVPHRTLRLRAHDVLLLEADPKKLTKVLSTLGLVFNEDKPKRKERERERERGRDRERDRERERTRAHERGQERERNRELERDRNRQRARAQGQAAAQSSAPTTSSAQAATTQSAPAAPSTRATEAAKATEPAETPETARATQATKETKVTKATETTKATKTIETAETTETTTAAQATKTARAAADAPSTQQPVPAEDAPDTQTTDADAEAHDRPETEAADDTPDQDDSSELAELVILPGSMLIGRSASDLRLRSQYQINLLAISRQGKRLRRRPRITPLRTGDVLLLQGPVENTTAFAQSSGCAPLATRELRVPNRRNMGIASAVMGFVIISAALGWWSAALSFVFGILLLLLFKVIAPRNLYRAVDWSVVVLLAALIPVAQAIEQTGAASLIAEFVLHQLAQGHATWALVLMMVTTMFLSDLMNNAATAAIMSPIAIQTAQQLDASTDTFLMAVAIGASCAFLTPIGHQNNTLILGPGGFRFSDYWRLGLPLDVLIVSTAIPLLLYFWPL
ncbi:MAG TPA: SLC13 family permease [Paenalcaligenes sp.]|nr:SLC13 family permease [Paenalcaligenes sp.]